jgi:hypothetical protein
VFVAQIVHVCRPARAGVVNGGTALGPGLDQPFAAAVPQPAAATPPSAGVPGRPSWAQ